MNTISVVLGTFVVGSLIWRYYHDHGTQGWYLFTAGIFAVEVIEPLVDIFWKGLL